MPPEGADSNDDDIEMAENSRQRAQKADKGNHTNSKNTLHRRKYLQGLGGVAALTSGIGMSSKNVSASSGRPNLDDWERVFEDEFGGGALDTSSWDIGWGWGTTANYATDGQISSDMVWVDSDNDWLVLDCDYDESLDRGPYLFGGVHTKNRVTFDPPVFLQASIRAMELPGGNTAWWCKPNNENWPPEIDFVEVPTQHIGESMHNIHYDTTASCTPAGEGDHASTTNGRYDPSGERLSDRFFRFEVLWTEDRITHWVDGNHVGTTTDTDVLTDLSQEGCLPHYMMFNNLLSSAGNWPPGDVPPPEEWDQYKTTTEMDWVRIWTPDGDSVEEDIGDDDEADENQFLWLKSADGDAVSFEFETDEDAIELQDGFEVDYWVDGNRAGGDTDRTEDLPGFWYEGEITGFEYEGDLDLYIDGEPVDPDSFGDLGAETETVIDGFEDLSRYSGATDAWNLDDAYTAFGDTSAASHSENAARIYARGDEFDDAFQRGDRAFLTCWFDADSGLQFGFGHENRVNRYVAGINSANGNLYLTRVSETAGWETLAFESDVVPTDDPHALDVAVDWSSGDADEIVVTIYDTDGTPLGSISGVDNAYDGSGISLTKTGGGSVWVDYLRKGSAAAPTAVTGDRSLEVSTLEATDVDRTAATLNGNLDALDGSDSAECRFQWLQYDAQEWSETSVETVSSTGAFRHELTDLDPGTEYGFRAVAETDDDRATGETLVFATDEDDAPSDPEIVDLRLEDRSNPVWSRFGAVWTVSDPDDNLNYVTSELFREGGSEVIDSDISSVDGGDAQGEHSLRDRDGSDGAYEVTLTVTDTDGNHTSITRSIEL